MGKQLLDTATNNKVGNGGKVNNYLWRKAEEATVKIANAARLATELLKTAYDPFSSNAKTGNKQSAKNRRGLSIAVSVAETCKPTAQCAGCYASEPESHSTYRNKLTIDMLNIARIRRNPQLFAYNVWVTLFKSAGKRQQIDGGAFYGVRWLSAGDLTKKVGDAITHWLFLSGDWTEKFGKPMHACVFSRKPNDVRYLIESARTVDATTKVTVTDRLAINFSLDGSLEVNPVSGKTGVEETYERLAVLGDAIDDVRLVQYAKEGDVLFDSAEVIFPHHDKRTHDSKWLPESFKGRVCPAIGNKNVGCMNCLTCYIPTVRKAVW